jgi:hypothetical protein
MENHSPARLAVAGDAPPETVIDEVIDQVHAETHAMLEVGSKEGVENPG